ncbi:hypothetical protein VTO42DRAFT_5144 [Malbranchea cinnamomea]
MYATAANGTPKDRVSDSHRLRRVPDDEIHNLIRVGFGPASLAIAIALHDRLEKAHQEKQTFRLDCPKVRFLERQPNISWHSGLLVPGSKMQISFIKDLATLRDPTTEEQKRSTGRLIEVFSVRSRNISTGVIVRHRTRHVVIAAGGQTKTPENFPKDPRIIHSSAYCTSLPGLPENRFASYHIGVI